MFLVELFIELFVEVIFYCFSLAAIILFHVFSFCVSLLWGICKYLYTCIKEESARRDIVRERERQERVRRYNKEHGLDDNND